MPLDPWFNILRTKLRHIPLEQRRRWAEDELHRWVNSVVKSAEIRDRELKPPEAPRIHEICRDLVGKDAVF